MKGHRRRDGSSRGGSCAGARARLAAEDAGVTAEPVAQPCGAGWCSFRCQPPSHESDNLVAGEGHIAHEQTSQPGQGEDNRWRRAYQQVAEASWRGRPLKGKPPREDRPLGVAAQPHDNLVCVGWAVVKETRVRWYSAAHSRAIRRTLLA